MPKEIVYIDMDGVLVDFDSGIRKLSPRLQQEYQGKYDEVEGIYGLMEPMAGAIEAAQQLAQHYDIYALSTAPWNNPSGWIDKIRWIQRYFGSEKDSIFYKRLILSHHKNLNRGAYLIDDRLRNGAAEFGGKHLHFGSAEFPNWASVLAYLIPPKK